MKLLLVEDELAQRQILRRELERLGHSVVDVATGAEAVTHLSEDDFDLAITDLNLPDFDGIEVIRRAREAGNELPILIITAYASLRTAIAGIHVGATDYLIKPIRIPDLARRLDQIGDLDRLNRENTFLRRVINHDTKTYWFPETADGEHIRELISKVGHTDLTVLILGESGTGKGVTARLIHSISSRSEGPFVSVNCGAMPENLIESELFGYTKGAFTGATKAQNGLFLAASGGTLFLDEIGNLPYGMQAKLLHAIEQKTVRPVGSTQDVPVDLRILAATNQNLEEMVKQKTFREDLLYRLNVFQLPLPPLRTQSEAIPSAVDYFMRKHAGRHGDSPVQIASEVWDRFMAYDWPGNLRELENAVERALVLCENNLIALADLPPALQFAPGNEPPTSRGALKDRVQVFERLAILKTIESVNGDRKRAAEILGIGLSTLYRKLEEDI